MINNQKESKLLTNRSEYQYSSGNTVLEAKYENLFKPEINAFYGEKERLVFPNWSKEVLKVDNLYNYTGDALFTTSIKRH